MSVRGSAGFPTARGSAEGRLRLEAGWLPARGSCLSRAELLLPCPSGQQIPGSAWPEAHDALAPVPPNPRASQRGRAPRSSRLQTLPLLAAGPRMCLTSGKAVSLFLWQSACETQDDTASETDKKFPSQPENTPVVLELVRTGSYHYACSIFPPGACSITMPGSPKLIAVLNNKIDCFLL